MLNLNTKSIVGHVLKHGYVLFDFYLFFNFFLICILKFCYNFTDRTGVNASSTLEFFYFKILWILLFNV